MTMPEHEEAPFDTAIHMFWFGRFLCGAERSTERRSSTDWGQVTCAGCLARRSNPQNDQKGSALKKRDGDQPLPRVNKEVSTQDSLMARLQADMAIRKQVGIERYGTLLQPFNGRDYIRDAWEELIDLAVYFEGVRRERDAMVALLLKMWQTGGRVYAMAECVTEAGRLLKSMGVEPRPADEDEQTG